MLAAAQRTYHFQHADRLHEQNSKPYEESGVLYQLQYKFTYVLAEGRWYAPPVNYEMPWSSSFS